MHQVLLVVLWVGELWVVCAIARAVISWFPLSYGSPFHRINTFLVVVTEPLIGPVRRLMPAARVGGVGIDVSFIVVVLVVQILLGWLRGYA